MGARGDAELVVEDLLAVPKDDLLLISVDAEHARLQLALDVSVIEESWITKGPFRGITDSDCLGKEGTIIGDHLFIRDNCHLTRKTRLSQSLSAVQTSRTSTNNHEVLGVVWVALSQGHGDLTWKTSFRNLNEPISIFLHDGERGDTVKTWGILRLSSDNREASSVGWAQDLVVEEHAIVERDTKVRAEVSS